MNLYISHNYRNMTSAGNKAKSDIEAIMSSEGFRNVGLRRTEYRSKAANFLLNLAGIIKAATLIRKGDVLFLQYPLKKYFTFISKIAHLKGAHVVALIHDLGSCRRKALSERKEIRRLSNADHVIATNAVMGQHLSALGLMKPISSLGAWDYLTKADPIPSRVGHGDIRVAYAGSLNRRKNKFLWEWGNSICNYVVDIYGSGFRMDEVARPECFYDHGFVSAEDLIAGMTSDYGLVWDGDSLDSCSGDFGEYLSLNSPHKVSLYIRAGLPVIIWSRAAMASFVKDNGIGIAIDSLRDLDKVLPAITREDYDRMKGNVAAMSRKIASGYFFRKSICMIHESLATLRKQS